MSHPLSPSPSTPVDSPAWDGYRESLKALGYSVTPLPDHEDSDVDPHVPSAAPDYDPSLDAAEAAIDARIAAIIREPELPTLQETIQERDGDRQKMEQTLHEILMSIYAVGNRLHDVLYSISSPDGGNWTRTTTGQLISQSTRSLSVAANALDIALNMQRIEK